jgi:hypothetical protein
MIPKECLEMTVKEYRKWQKENIRCDKQLVKLGKDLDSKPRRLLCMRECDVWHASRILFFLGVK